MDDHVVELALEVDRVIHVGMQIGGAHRGRQLQIHALQRVMHALGDTEKLIGAGDCAPLRV